MSLRRKTLYLYLGHLLFLLTAILVYLTVFMRKDLIEKEKVFLSDALNRGIEQFLSEIETYDRLSNYIFNDANVQSVINSSYQSEDTMKMYQAYENILEPSLNSYQLLTPNVSSLKIYTDCGLLPYKKHIDSVDTLKENTWYEQIRDNYNISWLTTVDTGSENMISARRMRFDLAYDYANYLVIGIPANDFFKPFSALSNEEYYLLIEDGKEHPIYSCGGLGKEDSAVHPRELLQNRNGYLFVSEKIDSFNWTVYYVKPAAVLLRTIYINLAVLFTGIGGGIALLLYFTYLMLRRTIINPIEVLAQDMQTVRIDQPPAEKFVSERTDEIGILISNYHEMLQKINSLIQEVYISQLNAKEYQLKVLRAQINPHFLYNILSLISAKAIMTDNEEISQISLLLSKFYRTCLNEGKDMTTVYNEIQNIKAYIEIQQLMNQHQFKAVYAIDENVYLYDMPNLILQPIVENAIMHGLNKSKKEEKQLKITASLTEREILFVIEDNGTGFSPGQAAAAPNKESSHFGLRNINERMSILYGELFQIQIQSKIGQGTCVTVIIPLG